VNVSLGAIADSTPIPTVLRTRLFSVAWLSRILGLVFGLANCTASPGRSLCIPHTDQLRRMVATADRSPARYIFELKLAEVPSGPLNCKLVLLRTLSDSVSASHVAAVSISYGYRRRFLRSRLVPARFRSPALTAVDALSPALTTSLRGRPGGRRVRLKASRSLGRMAHTIPTLIP
jgi:hypothetical protein